jgi:hypothetical protein
MHLPFQHSQLARATRASPAAKIGTIAMPFQRGKQCLVGAHIQGVSGFVDKQLCCALEGAAAGSPYRLKRLS